jgi:hypothetical protein
MVPVLSRGQSPAVLEFPAQKYLGARGMALGDAIGSDEYDIEAMYQNPATLTFLRAPGIMIDQRHDFSNQIFRENIAGRVFANRLQAVGLGFGVENAGKLTKNGPFNFLQYDLDAGYSFRLTALSPSLSIGVLGNLRMGKDDSASHSAARFSLGIMYSPAPGTSYSVIVRGMGTDLSYTAGDQSGVPVTRGEVIHVPRSLEIGSTMRYPAMSGLPYITLSIAGEKEFVSRVLRIRGGFEAIFLNVVSLRIGYVSAEARQFRYGMGILISRLSFDYAIMPTAGAGRFDELTLKYVL